MDYIAETKGALAIMSKEALNRFSLNLAYKNYLLNTINNKNPSNNPIKDKTPQKWLWRREKIPIAYRSVEWGNVIQCLKSNYWGRKISTFYERIKVSHYLLLNLVELY